MITWLKDTPSLSCGKRSGRWQVATTGGTEKAPNTELQAPEKPQAPNSKTAAKQEAAGQSADRDSLELSAPLPLYAFASAGSFSSTLAGFSAGAAVVVVPVAVAPPRPSFSFTSVAPLPRRLRR